MQRYCIGAVLGEGAFGKVREATHKETGEQVCDSFSTTDTFLYMRKCMQAMLLTFALVAQVAIKTLKDKCKDIKAMMALPEVKVSDPAVTASQSGNKERDAPNI